MSMGIMQIIVLTRMVILLAGSLQQNHNWPLISEVTMEEDVVVVVVEVAIRIRSQVKAVAAEVEDAVVAVVVAVVGPDWWRHTENQQTRKRLVQFVADESGLADEANDEDWEYFVPLVLF